MAGEDAGQPAAAGKGGYDALLGVERNLRACLETLDAFGLSQAAAHLDLALHQLRRDCDELRSSGREAAASGRGSGR